MERLPEPLDWLAAGVPLTLLIDLLGPGRPESAEIFTAEAGDAAWWLTPVTNAA